VLSICGNKLHTTLKLVRHGVPTPRTYIAFSGEEVVKISNKLGYPVVLKPIIGSWGRLLAKVGDEDSLISILEHRVHLHNPIYKIFYVQEYIRKPGRDIRVLTIGDRVPAAIYRVSKNWRTNTALGGRAVKVEINDELRELALKASKAIGGGILGIDVLEDSERGMLVNEVNAVVEFKNTVRATGVDISSIIVDYLVEEAKR